MATATAASPADRSRAPSSWPRRLRQLHLYLGALFAPAILFFAVSGALQEFNLHEPSPGAGYRPAAWVVRLASVHKHQTLSLPVEKRREPARPGKAAAEPPAAPPPARPGTVILRGFFAATAAGLFISTLIGLYLAFRFTRRPRVVLALVAVGLAAPLALLLL